MKKFFVKIKDWFVRHKPSKRRLIQIYAALLYNANIKGFFGSGANVIYRGNTKYACVPGLNCYSCPGAVGACPLGALQNALAASNTTAPYYILGILALFGLLLGRTICGFLCPVGLGQELLYKIKTPKLKKNRATRILSYLKYVLLAVLVVILTIVISITTGAATPAFCKYICPAGTFGGGVGLLANPENSGFFAMLSGLFTWKFILLVVFVVLSIFIYRFFCRFICPLGAIYGFFNKFALLGVKLDKQKCTDCGLCISHCKMDIKHVGDHECINCGDCISVCPTHAITWKGSKIFLPQNEVEAEKEVPSISAVLQSGTTVSAVSKAETLAIAPMEVVEVKPDAQVDMCECAKTTDTENLSAEPEQTEKHCETVDCGKKLTKIKKRNKWLEIAAWSLAGIVLIFAFVYYNFLAKEPEYIVYRQGDKCPDFTIQTFEGETNGEFNLYSVEDKVVVLNFWYTTCGPCVEELPHFNTFQQNYSDDVIVVAVHRNTGEDIQAFLNENGWDKWSVTFAKDALVMGLNTAPLYESLGGKAVWPMTVVLDKTKHISSVRQGKMSYEELERNVKEALEK